MRHLRMFTFFLITVFCLVKAFNHPEIEWKTVNGKNVTINYYDKTEPAVFAVWHIAEDVFASLAPLYNYTPHQKIAISVAEHDDFSNGFAEWLAGNILIWLPDAHFNLRSNTVWLRNVITHEMAHIMSLEQKRIHQLVSIDLSFMFSTPQEHYGFTNPLPKISVVPTWLAEGIAQFEAEQKHNDAFDSRREMLLRCAVRSNSMLTLDEMGNFNHDRIGNELVYNQGFAFTRYLAGQIGIKNLRSIFSKSTTRQIDFFEEFYRLTSLKLESVYNNWIDSLRSAYAYRFSSVKETCSTISRNGTFNLLPKYSPDGSLIAWFTSGSDDGDRTDLLLSNSNDFSKVRRISYAHTSFCFSNNSTALYYIKSRTPNNNGSYFNDLFMLDIATGREKRITCNARIYDIAPFPNSTTLLCVAYSTKGFGLYTCDVETGALTQCLEAEPGNPIMQGTVNPNNENEIIFSQLVHGQSRLYIMSGLQPATCKPLSAGNAQEESPFWAANGRIYYSADYDGVFNIYSCKADGSDLLRHTSTADGHFSPHLSPKGTLVTSFYTRRNFSIVTTPLFSDPFTPNDPPRPSFTPLPTPEGAVTIKSLPYEALYRRSTWQGFLSANIIQNNMFLPDVFMDEPSMVVVSGGLARVKSDALHKKQHVLSLGIAAIGDLGYSNSFKAFSRQSDWIEKIPASKALLHNRTLLAQFLTSAQTPANEQLYGMYTKNRASQSKQQQPSQLSVIAQPGFAYENSSLAPTLGFQATALLRAGNQGFKIGMQSYFLQQISHEWSCGGVIDLITSSLITQLTTPVFLRWAHSGYNNEDISYNSAGLSQMEIGGSYLNQPSLTVNKDSDSIMIKTEGWQLQLYLTHAFPILKYSSLMLSSFSSARIYSKPILDVSIFNDGNFPSKVLDGESDRYLFSANSVKLTFPLIRTINKGSRYYLDALYGFIAYSVTGYANHKYLESEGRFSRRALTQSSYMPESFFIDHRISYGCNLGIHKSYLFFSMARLSLSHSFIRKSTTITITAGM